MGDVRIGRGMGRWRLILGIGYRGWVQEMWEKGEEVPRHGPDGMTRDHSMVIESRAVIFNQCATAH